jgi:AcrR family transcriptional regulator
MPTPPDALSLRKAPRQRRAAHTVDAILEAAALVLEADGLEGFNTNAVARRAGASIGTLYQYFPSKDALTLALSQREKGKFYQAAAAAVALPGYQPALAAFILVAASQQLTRPNLARLLDQQEERADMRAVLNAASPFTDLLIALLQKPDAPGHLRDAGLHAQAAGDMAALIQSLTDAAGQRGETDVGDLTRRIGAAVAGYLHAGG